MEKPKNSDFDEKTESILTETILVKFEEQYNRDVWTSKWFFFLFLVTFCNAPWQLQIATELSNEISPGVFVVIMIFSKLIFVLPVLIIELFLGAYTKLSFGQLYKCAPIFYGFSLSCALLNLNYLQITSLITCQGIIYLSAIILGHQDWQSCPESPIIDKYNSTCYDARVMGPWESGDMGTCERVWPMHIQCTGFENPLQFPALYHYWQRFQDPDVYLTEYRRDYLWSTSLVWICTCYILFKGVVYLHKVLIISLSFTFFITMYFSYYVFFTSAKNEVIKHVFTFNWTKITHLTVDRMIWYIMWRTPIGYPNVYMTASAYYDGPKLDATFIGFILFVISDAYTALFIMTTACITSTLSDSLGGNSTLYVVDNRGILYATIPELLTGSEVRSLFTFIYFMSFSMITLAQHVSLAHVFLLDIFDFFPQFKELKKQLLMPFCFIMFIAGLPLVEKKNAFCNFQLYFTMLSTHGLIFSYVGQIIILFIFYGVARLRKDYIFATGSPPMLGFVVSWVLLPLILAIWIPDFLHQTDLYVQNIVEQSKCSLRMYHFVRYLLISLLSFTIVVAIWLFTDSFSKNKITSLFKPSFLWGPPGPRQRLERKLGGVVKTAETLRAEKIQLMLEEAGFNDDVASELSLDSQMSRVSQYSMEKPNTKYDRSWSQLYPKKLLGVKSSETVSTI